MKVHPFYRCHNLRLHEIPKGVKCPVVVGWPDTNWKADDIEPRLTGKNNKYGWLLDDDHLVIDIDLHNAEENGLDSLEKFQSAISIDLDEACKAIVYSPSGGRHYYFRKPQEYKFGKTFKALYPGIDFISGHGKQVIAANSCHDKYEGTYQLSEDAELVDLPQAILDYLFQLSEKKPQQSSTPTDDRSGDEFNKSQRGLSFMVSTLQAFGYTVRSVGDYFEFDRPNKSTDSKCSGHVGKKSKQGNYQLTYFSLSGDHFPSGESLSLFHAYALLAHNGNHSQAADALYRFGFAEKHINDFADFMVSVPCSENGVCLSKPDKRPQLDESVMQPPGLLGDMVRFIRDTARYDLPEVALASVLAFTGMILGRRVRAIDDTRPNLFCLSIAESGTGKNHPRQTIKRMMHAAGIDIPREGAASATAVARMIAKHPSLVIQIDEAGLAFRAMKNPRSPQAELGGLLSELFTSSNGFFSYRAYADSKNESPVDQPHLSINAITTEQQLYAGGFTHEDIEQGLFGRFLLFRPQAMDPDERFDLEVEDVPESIVDRIRSWWAYMPWDSVANANLLPDHPSPMVIPFSDAAKARYRSYASAITERMKCEDTFRKALWRRSKEKTSRLALVHACMQSGYRQGIVIDKDSMDWAIAISNYSTRGMVYDMDHAMIESVYQANLKYFLSKIPPEGIDKWQLGRKLRKFRPKERDEMLTDLLGSEVIKIEEIGTGTKPRSIVKLA